MTNTIKSLVVVFAFFIIATATLAQNKFIKIESKVTIKTSQQTAYDLVRQLERFPEWSPFLVTDPQQKYYVEGENGSVGSIFHWEGVEEKSLGYQELTVLKDQNYIRLDCTVVKPFKGSAYFEYHFREIEGGVEITQNYVMPVSGFNKFMINLFGVKKEMRNTNELGLVRLKNLLEQNQNVAVGQ